MKKVTLLMALVYLAGAFANGQSNAVFEIIPENPGSPLILETSHMFTGAIVSGYDGENILVELYRSNGRSRMKNPPIQYSENDNRIVLSHGLTDTRNLQYKIKVPLNTSLKLDGSMASYFEVNDIKGDVVIDTFNADIKVTNLEGDLDAETFKGDISVENLKGSPLLSTNDGDVELAFSELPGSYPNIVICNYGNLKLYLNQDDKVSLRFKMVFNFEKVRSDFRLQALNPKSFPMGVEGEDNFYRAINGGGVPIYLRQFKGSVAVLDASKKN